VLVAVLVTVVVVVCPRTLVTGGRVTKLVRVTAGIVMLSISVMAGRVTKEVNAGMLSVDVRPGRVTAGNVTTWVIAGKVKTEVTAGNVTVTAGS